MTMKRSLIDVTAADTSSPEEEIELNTSVQMQNLISSKLTAIDDFPPEIIEAILNNLTTVNLLSTRQLNRKWYEISSRILRQRDDMVLSFRFKKGHFMRSECDSKSLNDLMDCFKHSKIFIYTHFDFGYLLHFENEDISNFFSICGKCIHYIDIAILATMKNVETLRKLLSEQVPKLKKLKIRFLNEFACGGSVPTTVQLFDDPKFQLPKLKTLIIIDRYRKLPAITEGILKAACNLKLLQTDFFYDSTDDIEMLLSINCRKKIKICLTEDLITHCVNNSKSFNLKLESLDLSLGYILARQKLILGATSVINLLLESSKDVIETLGIEPIGLLPGVVFPKFKKLRTLQLHKPFTSIKSAMFPPLIQMADIFPGLNELDTYVPCNDVYFPLTQPLKPMPSVEKLGILTVSENPSTESKEKLTKMTPNVKILSLDEDSSWSESRDRETFINEFRVIINNLTKLETIDWFICNSTHHELLYSLDAAITGFPDKFCKKMSLKFRNKDCLSANEIASIESQRQHSSILDLKCLKNLTFHFIFNSYAYMEMDDDERFDNIDEAGHSQTHVLFKTGLTKFSQFLGFNLIMPNSKIHIGRCLK